MSLAAKFLLGSASFFILAAGAAAYMFFVGGNVISPQNIDMEVIAPSLIDGGKEASFQIIITNRNQVDLELVDLVVDYPQGTRSVSDSSQTLQHERQSIGVIKSGQQIKRTVSAIFYGQEGSQQTLKATIEYSVKNSNGVYERSSQADFTVGSSPVSLSIQSPSETTAGQQFSMDITVRSNATAPVTNVVIQGQYPFGFSVLSSQPQAEAGGTLWRLGTMAPGTTKIIHLTGSIDGQDGDERVFRFLAGSNADQTDTKIKVPFVTVPQTVTVNRSFITGTISVEGKTGKTISATAGSLLQGSIDWQNNLTDSVSDVELVLTLSGPALDKNTIAARNGFYQSADSSITWSKDQDGSLASVVPGGFGTVQFSFATLPPGANSVLITNPTITLTLTVRGVRQAQGGVSQTVSSAASLQVQLTSQLSLSAQSLHFTGPFTNSGPMPPRAEVATLYTILWTVKNSANTVANATVSTTLPPYVQFSAAQNGSGITYDEGSRTVRWALGDVKAGVGYTLAARQAAFQVVLIASTAQVNTVPILTNGATLSGTDRFAQVQVSAVAENPTTRVIENGFQNGMDIVGPKQ